MPRPLRVDYPGAIHHAGTLGNRSEAIVFDDHDRQHLLWLVQRMCEHYDLECGAYCVMTTHYHLILRSRTGRISRGMAMLNSWFARWVNARYERRGHVFGERFFNRVMEDGGYRREVARYLPLNPVRAGVVADAESWSWSSYAASIGVASAPSFLSPFIVDEWFGGSQAAYRAWVLAGGGSETACLDTLFVAYDGRTAVSIAMNAHGIAFSTIATHLRIKERTLRERLQVDRSAR